MKNSDPNHPKEP